MNYLDLLKATQLEQNGQQDPNMPMQTPYTALLKQRETNINELQDKLSAAEGRDISWDQKINLQPIAAAFDSIYGSNMARGISAPIAEKAKAHEVEALRNALGKEQGGLVDDQYNLSRLMVEDQRTREMASQRSQEKDADRALRERLAKLAGAKGSAPSPFEKKKQEALGKGAAEWITKDRDTFASNLNKVDKALELLSQGKNLSAPGTQAIPDFIRKQTNPDAIVARDSMQSAIQDTLRPTLGAQFTENEGKRIMALAYNEGLGDKENARRAAQLKEIIQRKIEATDALYAYLQANNGSDAGFPYEKYNMRKVGSATTSAKPQAAGPQVGEVKNGYRFKGGNPADQASWEKVQ